MTCHNTQTLRYAAKVVWLTYRHSPKNKRQHIKRYICPPEALISRFLVSNGSDALDINVEFKAPFDTILEPIKDNVAQVNQARRNGLKKLSELVEMTKNHIRNIYGCDFHVSDSPNPIYPELTSNEPNFFMVKSSSKDFLVDLAGVEPASESPSIEASPITVIILTFPPSVT